MTFEISDHFLVPKHVLLSSQQVEDLLKKYGITLKQLPRLSKTDPLVKELDADKDSVVKIVRTSRTAGKAIYYRRVM